MSPLSLQNWGRNLKIHFLVSFSAVSVLEENAMWTAFHNILALLLPDPDITWHWKNTQNHNLDGIKKENSLSLRSETIFSNMCEYFFPILNSLSTLWPGSGEKRCTHISIFLEVKGSHYSSPWVILSFNVMKTYRFFLQLFI